MTENAESGNPLPEVGQPTANEEQHPMTEATAPTVEAPLSPGVSSAPAADSIQPSVVAPFTAVNAPLPSIDSTLPDIDKSIPTFDGPLPLSDSTAPISDPLPIEDPFSDTQNTEALGDHSVTAPLPVDNLPGDHTASQAPDPSVLSSANGTHNSTGNPAQVNNGESFTPVTSAPSNTPSKQTTDSTPAQTQFPQVPIGSPMQSVSSTSPSTQAYSGQLQYQLAGEPNHVLSSGSKHRKEVKRRTKTGCLTCRRRRIKVCINGFFFFFFFFFLNSCSFVCGGVQFR